MNRGGLKLWLLLWVLQENCALCARCAQAAPEPCAQLARAPGSRAINAAVSHRLRARDSPQHVRRGSFAVEVTANLMPV